MFSADCGFCINIQRISQAFPVNAVLTPKFPGLVFRTHCKPGVVAIIFASGKLILTGARNESDAQKSFVYIFLKILCRFKLSQSSKATASAYRLSIIDERDKDIENELKHVARLLKRDASTRSAAIGLTGDAASSSATAASIDAFDRDASERGALTLADMEEEFESVFEGLVDPGGKVQSQRKRKKAGKENATFDDESAHDADTEDNNDAFAPIFLDDE